VTVRHCGGVWRSWRPGRRWGNCSLWLAALALLAVAGSARASDQPFDERRLARQLTDDDYEARRAAEQELLDAGQAALPFLSSLARQSDPELSSRCVRILDRLFVSSDAAVADAADTTLDALADDRTTPAATLARQSLTGWQAIREQRAIAALKKLGAKVDVGPDLFTLAATISVESIVPDWIDDDSALLQEVCTTAAQGDSARKRIPQSAGNVWFTPHWTGGEQGLKHLGRLSGVNPLLVYVVKGASVSIEAVKEAGADVDSVAFTERGPSLGVQSDGGTPYCVIGSVLPGGAAHKAGLQAGDQVLAVNDHTTRHFSDLIAHIGDRKVGESVKLTVQRGFRGIDTETVTVKLGDWTEVDTATPLWEQPRVSPPQPIWLRGLGFPK
jgi:hypothetical protein